MLLCVVAVLLAAQCSAAPDRLAVMVTSPVSVHRGHTTTLPCWLNPPQSAEDLEVHWYRSDQFNSPIILYHERKFDYASKNTLYVGRVSFGSKDAAFGGLRSGDVSLKLENVSLADAGEYNCYVSSDQDHDKAIVSLAVKETGSPVFLSAVWRENNVVNVSCASRGWYPKPSLSWSHEKQALTPDSVKFSQDSNGLFTVHSWLLVSSSPEVSCSVSLFGDEAKEARLYLHNPLQPDEPQSSSSSTGWIVAFAVFFIATLVFLGLMYYKLGAKNKKKGAVNTEEEERLLKEVTKPSDLSTAEKYYVNVTLALTEHQYLRIRDGYKVRDNQAIPDTEKVTCLTAIRGTPGFSSGQHYWQVSMEAPNVEPKQSWWLGVTSVANIPLQGDFCPTASKGFWFLSLSPDTHFQLSTEPKVSLPFTSRPRTVGVFLNYDSGELSFYNVELKSFIGSLTAEFEGEVFPLFNPGLGDRGIMTIVQRPPEEDKSSDVGMKTIVQKPPEEDTSSDVGMRTIVQKPPEEDKSSDVGMRTIVQKPPEEDTSSDVGMRTIVQKPPEEDKSSDVGMRTIVQKPPEEDKSSDMGHPQNNSVGLIQETESQI